MSRGGAREGGRFASPDEQRHRIEAASERDAPAAAHFDRLLPSLATQAEAVDRFERAGDPVLAVDVSQLTSASDIALTRPLCLTSRLGLRADRAHVIPGVLVGGRIEALVVSATVTASSRGRIS